MVTIAKMPTVHIDYSMNEPVYTFTDLNPELPYYGLSEDDYYQFCLRLLEIVGGYQYYGFIRAALEYLKNDPDIEDGDEAASAQINELLWEGCNVKTDLRDLRKILPNKADRRLILWGNEINDSLLWPDGELWIPAIDEDHCGEFFNYDEDRLFSWTLSGIEFFSFVYNYEVTHGI